MRLLTCMLLVMVLVGTAAAAAPVHTAKGDKAMVFKFEGLSDLDLHGYGDCWGVGMRYYFADMNAIRAGITFGNDNWTDVAQEEGEDDLEHKESEIGFEANYERHLEAPCASVSPYIGAGFSFYRWKSECPLTGARDYPKDVEEESGFDVHAMAGFEWGFTECMTLGGEYELGFFSGSWKEEYESGGETSTIAEEEYSWMGFSTAALYLSVYW